MYTIKKINRKITSVYDSLWNIAETAKIEICNWQEYARDINTTAKILYDDYGIFVRMETDEKPLLARHTEQNSAVCRDSCMEFFISPNCNDKRYLNFEFNPFGTMLMSVRTSNDEWYHPEDKSEYFNIQSKVTEDSWILQFYIPFEFCDRIFGTHTKVMKGNIYKCGGEAVKKHYISYYPIKTMEPKFHSPEFFGEFILE